MNVTFTPFFSPHLNSCHGEIYAPDVTPDYWYKMDLVILQFATAILLLPNWQKSEGSKLELAYAEKRGIISFDHNEFNDFVGWWHRKVGFDAIH